MAGRALVSRVAAVLARMSSHESRGRPRASASRLRLLRMEGLEGREMLAAQVVTPSVAAINVDPGDAVSFSVSYTTDTGNAYTTGLGLRLHYDSSKMTPDTTYGSYWPKITATVYNGLSGVVTSSLSSNQETPTADVTDLDGDASTDMYILVAWAAMGGDWPGEVPKTLYTAHFIAATGSEAVGSANFNFTASSVAAGYTFESTSVEATFNVATPEPDAGGPYAVVEGASVALDASATTHATQDPATLTYAWDFDGDGSYDDATGITPSFSAANADGPSSITVGLQVTDANNVSATDTAVINVSNAVPTASIAAPTDGYAGVRGQLRTFTLSATDPSSVDTAGTFTYDIDWGDGSSEQVVGTATGTTASHAYTTTGSFTASVTVTDKDGGMSASASAATQTIGIFERQGANIALGGTTDADTFSVAQSGRARRLALTLNGLSYGTYTLSSTGSLLVFGQDGADTISIAGSTSTDYMQLTTTGLILNGATLQIGDIETWTLSGLNGTDTLVAPNTANTWALGAADAGTLNTSISFTGMEKLIGGNSTDVFTLSSSTKTYAVIDGGGGGGTLDYSDYGQTIALNMATSSAPLVSRYQNITLFVADEEATGNSTIRGGNGTNTWIISGANAGTLNGAAFQGFKNLYGGRGADTFIVQNGGSIAGTVDGVAGCDVLDYASYTTGVTVNLATYTATALGAAKNFRMVIGTDLADSLTAGAAASVLMGGAGADTLQGGAGRDILIGGQGADTLSGGGGDDILFGGVTSGVTPRTLDTILQQWNRPLSYAIRVARIMTVVSPTALINDSGAVDQLYGEGDTDWFLYYLTDAINDQVVGTEEATILGM
jgi:hypothetical protein